MILGTPIINILFSIGITGGGVTFCFLVSYGIYKIINFVWRKISVYFN